MNDSPNLMLAKVSRYTVFLFYPVSKNDVQCIMHDFLLEGHIIIYPLKIIFWTFVVSFFFKLTISVDMWSI